MKLTNSVTWCRRSMAAVALAILLVCPAGHAEDNANQKGTDTKENPHHERGWIGGEYRAATSRAFPHAAFPTDAIFYYDQFPACVSQTQKAAIFIKGLGTNTPARLAGLQERDLIVALNGKPVTTLRKFHRIIDHARPGTTVQVTAYRYGGRVEYNVPVGREVFDHFGTLGVTFPTVVHGWDLWPNPDFSFVLVGWELNRGVRHELKGKKREVYDQDWGAWVGIFELWRSKHILSQENVPAAGANQQ